MIKLDDEKRFNRSLRHAYYFWRSYTKKGMLIRRANEELEKFGIRFESDEEKKQWLSDMLKMNRYYGYEADEYLYLGFHEKDMKERLKYVSDWERIGYTSAMNNPKNGPLFDDKWQTYNTFKPFYHRDVVLIEEGSGKQVFFDFLNKHGMAVSKPISESCGRGVKILNANSDVFAQDKEDVVDRLLEEYQGRFILEEKIEQISAMATFHPLSVNTVRVPTVRFDDGVRLIHPFLRLGQHDSMVDNGGAGGILCAVNADTGVVIAAADKRGNRYTIHPDTGERIIGFEIPRWDELIDVSKKLAQVVPDNRYTGWDLALTDWGWVVVEANRRGQFGGIQITTQTGFREELNGIMRQLGIKY